jgi:hypothetical protein
VNVPSVPIFPRGVPSRIKPSQMPTIRIRLGVPLNLFLNARDPSLLDPSLKYDYSDSEIHVTLKGGEPIELTASKSDEPHFRTIHECQIEIREKNDPPRLLQLVESKSFSELVNLLMPIVNRTLAAIRNFGWVTTAKKYKPEEKPETLLQAWGAKARIRGKWTEIAPKPKRDEMGLYGLFALNENTERGSLSIGHWRDIEQALVEGLKPNPEQEFLTNSLQHIEREKNLRLALIEATVCLEIVLSECLRLHLQVRRHFDKKKINSVLNNVGLTSKVGLFAESLLSLNERSKEQVDKVLKAITWRNKIIHASGHIPESVPDEDVKEAIYSMLNLSLTLGRKRDKLRAEPEMEKVSAAIAELFQCPRPEMEALKYHEISANFSFRSKTPSYLQKIEPGLPADDKVPDQDGLQQIIEGLESEIRKRDRYFEARKHLSAKFQRGFVGPVVFAFFEKGVWKHMVEPTAEKPAS